MLEIQMWMSIIFNNFPSCIISLSIQKLIGKGLYCKSLLKPICLHFYKSEIFCKRTVLSKTSTSDCVLELDLLGRYNKSPVIFAIESPTSSPQQLLQVLKGTNCRSMVAPIVQLFFPRPILSTLRLIPLKLIFKYTPPVCISQGTQLVKQTK